MLLHLCSHMCPEIAFVMYQYACYRFCPTWHHELALICIGNYHKGSMSKSLIMSPSNTSCYPDADFLACMVPKILRTLMCM
ncbi:hypothetical protein ACHAW6_004845 [Cyclotella cf. meneghiniana]